MREEKIPGKKNRHSAAETPQNRPIQHPKEAADH